MHALLSTTRCDWDTSTVVAEITRAALSISLLSVIGSAQRQWAKNPVLLPLLLQLSFHGVVKVCRGGQQPLWAHEQDGKGSAGPIQLREPPGAPLTVILGRGELTRTAIFAGRRTEFSLKTPAVQQMCAVTVTGHRPEGRVSLPGSEVTERPRCSLAAPDVPSAALAAPPLCKRATRAEPRAERPQVATGGTAASPAPKPRAANGPTAACARRGRRAQGRMACCESSGRFGQRAEPGRCGRRFETLRDKFGWRCLWEKCGGVNGAPSRTRGSGASVPRHGAHSRHRPRQGLRLRPEAPLGAVVAPRVKEEQVEPISYHCL